MQPLFFNLGASTRAAFIGEQVHARTHSQRRLRHARTTRFIVTLIVWQIVMFLSVMADCSWHLDASVLDRQRSAVVCFVVCFLVTNRIFFNKAHRCDSSLVRVNSAGKEE
jgi:hypothetical protein